MVFFHLDMIPIDIVSDGVSSRLNNQAQLARQHGCMGSQMHGNTHVKLGLGPHHCGTAENTEHRDSCRYRSTHPDARSHRYSHRQNCRYDQIWFAVSYKYLAKIASIFAAA